MAIEITPLPGGSTRPVHSGPFEKRSYRIKELVTITGLGRSSINRLIAAGKLRAVKSEGCTLILREDLDAFYAALRAPS